MIENGSESLRRLTKNFEDGRKLAQLSCCCLQSCACLSSEWAAELLAFEGFLSAVELYNGINHLIIFKCFSQVHHSINEKSDRTLGVAFAQFDRKCFCSRLELQPRLK